TPQIQAWPPVGDPGIARAVEASNYWALKEQQQQQQQMQQQQRPRQAYPVNSQQQQYQNQRMPAGAPQQYGRQQIPQQGRAANVPQSGQVMLGKQYRNPGHFSDYRINSTQTPAQQAAPFSERNQQYNDQQQLREAARTGMNLGPGQMFPVVAGSQKNSNASSLMSAQFPSNTHMPASAQVTQQNAYQAGGANIQQAQVRQPINQRQAVSNIRQVGYEPQNQQSPQRNGFNASAQIRNADGYRQGSAALPQSAMFSTNPAIAPANIRSIQPNTNQNANQLGSSPVQWGSQPSASPYQFPVQNNRY
ncbi:MAG: hypothetical protein QM501_05210, partial [Gimesia sp.]